MANPQKTSTDNVILERRPRQWRSAYPDEAWKEIRKEGWYLGIHMLISLAAIFCVWWLPWQNFMALNLNSFSEFQLYIICYFSGILGGTAFAMKWLYHAVAKRGWHLDRRAWRYCTPHISGILAISLFALLDSGLLNIIIKTPNNAFALGFGFLVGYFSDRAAAKLSDIAYSIFGKTER